MWNRLISKINTWIDYFYLHRQQEKATVFFLKAIIVFALLRTLHLWSQSGILFHSENVPIGSNIFIKTLFLPAILAPLNIHVFFAVAVFFLVLAIILKPNYFVNGVFFWYVLNLLKLKYPNVDGSDYVLVLFAMYTIPFAGKNIKSALTNSVFNFARVALQWQVILIYLISGVDKVFSPTWRSGDAFVLIRNYEVMFNPWFSPIMEFGSMPLIMSWATIIFELFFGVLIYVKRTRLVTLCVGIIFHIVIWLMLGLPGFALIMILGYMIFLVDSDLENLLLRFKR